MTEAMVRAVADNEARVNITYAGQNGDLPDPVSVDATDDDVKRWVTEALRTGSVPGIPASPGADLGGFKVDRFGPTEVRPHSMMTVRPKTEYGADAVQIVVGLQIDVPSGELKDLLEKRLQYHKDRVDAYKAQVEQFRKAVELADDEARSIGKSSSTTPLENLETALKKHVSQVTYYDFMSKHVVEGATYRLSENDLVRIGVQSERYY